MCPLSVAKFRNLVPTLQKNSIEYRNKSLKIRDTVESDRKKYIWAWMTVRVALPYSEFPTILKRDKRFKHALIYYYGSSE